MLNLMISLWRSCINTNEEENKQKKESMYLQSCPTNCTDLHVEEWKICCLEAKFMSQIHTILVLDIRSALIKTKDDMVYGVGDNRNGRLGLSNKDHRNRKPKKVDVLCARNIKTFYSSTDANCIFALTEEGEVYSWGSNENCRLGKRELKKNKTKIYMPAKMNSLSGERIIDIASNNYNSLALTNRGKIYVWGNVDFTKNSRKLQDQPCQVTKLEKMKIVQIACGMSFVMALTDDGKLYSWGENRNGQLGISSENDICIYPCLITLEKVQIDKIACGSEHSLALTSKGKIYSWGNNCKGQLGHGRKYELRKEPTMLKWTANEKTIGIISDIAAQNNLSAAVNTLGSVYVWGFHSIYERDTELESYIWKPIRIQYLDRFNAFRYIIPYIICTEFDDQLTSDLIIEVEGKCIYVHKSVLIRCEYFKNMFQDDLGEVRNNIHTIKYDDFSYNVYKVFLRHFYTDVALYDHLSLEEIHELFKLCNKYTEENIAKKCDAVIKETLSVSNVGLCFATAIESNAEDLAKHIIEFSSGQMSKIINSGTLDNLSKEQLLDFLMRANNAGHFKCKKCVAKFYITAKK